MLCVEILGVNGVHANKQLRNREVQNKDRIFLTQKLTGESREVDSGSAKVGPDRNQRIIVAIRNDGNGRRVLTEGRG